MENNDMQLYSFLLFKISSKYDYFLDIIDKEFDKNDINFDLVKECIAKLEILDYVIDGMNYFFNEV